MPEIITLEQTTPSIAHLCKRDKHFEKVYSLVGPITYKPYEDGYSFLVSQIIGQMLSNKVSRKINERLNDLCGGNVTPHAVALLTDDQIKGIGTSRPKVSYIRSLTEAINCGDLNFQILSEMPDAEAIKYLTKIKGIGTWSAKMYLIFVLNRQDILPYEDVAFLQGYAWPFIPKTAQAQKLHTFHVPSFLTA